MSILCLSLCVSVSVCIGLSLCVWCLGSVCVLRAGRQIQLYLSGRASIGMVR